MTTKDIEDWIYGLRPDFPLYKNVDEVPLPEDTEDEDDDRGDELDQWYRETIEDSEDDE